MRNFIFLFDRFSLLYGKPIDYHSKISIDNIVGETRTIYFMWWTESDTIEMEYIVMSPNDQLCVRYRAGRSRYIK